MQSRWNLVETLLSKMQIHLMMLTQRQYKAHDGGKRRAAGFAHWRNVSGCAAPDNYDTEMEDSGNSGFWCIEIMREL